MDLSNALPQPPSAEDYEKFGVSGSRAVQALLADVASSHNLVIAREGATAEFWVTRILAVRNGQVILDRPVAPVREAIGGLEVHTELDDVRIAFSCGPAMPVVHEGVQALSLPLPLRAVRYQRRDGYRVDAPVADPVLCLVRGAPKGTSSDPIALPLADISIGGCSVIDHGAAAGFEAGMALPFAWIELPGVGPIGCDLRVVHAEHEGRDGVHRRRLGCRFEGLNHADRLKLQQYVMRLEAEWLRRR